MPRTGHSDWSDVITTKGDEAAATPPCLQSHSGKGEAKQRHSLQFCSGSKSASGWLWKGEGAWMPLWGSLQNLVFCTPSSYATLSDVLKKILWKTKRQISRPTLRRLSKYLFMNFPCSKLDLCLYQNRSQKTKYSQVGRKLKTGDMKMKESAGIRFMLSWSFICLTLETGDDLIYFGYHLILLKVDSKKIIL